MTLEEVLENSVKEEMSILRLLVSVVTHVIMQEGLTQGYTMMKYAVNHHWKFHDYRLAFLTGFLSVTISMLIEIATFYMLLFASEEFFAVLEKFAVVILIADFGIVFYTLEKDEKNKAIITEPEYEGILKWEITTSKSARCKVPQNLLEPEDTLKEELA